MNRLLKLISEQQLIQKLYIYIYVSSIPPVYNRIFFEHIYTMITNLTNLISSTHLFTVSSTQPFIFHKHFIQRNSYSFNSRKY